MNVKRIVKKYVPMIAREVGCWDRYKTAQRFLKLHPQPKLTYEEKRDIDIYWGNIKFPDYSWHEMYYGVTGIHDPRFIPDPILGSVCYPYYNMHSHVYGWNDKNVFELLVHDVQFPYSLCHCINGNYFDNRWNCYKKDNLESLAEEIYKCLNGKTDIVCKEATRTSCGKGVRLMTVNSVNDIFCFLKDYNSNNYILQTRVVQHPFFNQFNPTSSNIIRIISWRYENEIIILSASIRFGIEGSFTDIAFVNGKEIANVVGIDKDGYVKDRFVSLDGKITDPPRITDKKVPSWELLFETVKKAHKDLLFFDVVGWDFMIDENGKPICIEYNINGPGAILYQYANGPFAGDYTDMFLDFLKSANRSEIPLFFRR